MATITRESRQAPVALPAADRVDGWFGAVAVLVGFAAVIAKVSGLFG